MVMKILTNIVLAVALMGCQACEDELELPPITTEGKNTFGCKVNGAVYLPKGGALQGGSKNADIVYESDTAKLVIGTRNFDADQSVLIELFDTPDFDVAHNEYVLTNEKYRVYYREDGDCNNCGCQYDIVETGFLKLLRYDKQENIISGTFEFTARSPNSNCQPAIKITEGRFDMPFLPYNKN
jgi:hypothetical protein